MNPQREMKTPGTGVCSIALVIFSQRVMRLWETGCQRPLKEMNLA